MKDGRLLGLGVSMPERDALLPDVPTVDEAGVPGYQTDLWFGLLTSAAVPRPLIDKLNRDIVRVLGEAELKSRWSAIGIVPTPMSADAFDRRIREQVDVFTRFARSANIKAD